MKTLIGEVLVIFLIGFLSIFDGIRLVRAKELQTFDALGPGYYSVGIGAVLIIVGIAYFLIERKTVAENAAAKAMAGPATADYKKTMIGMLAVMAGYIVLVDYVGYLLSTAVFFLFINRIVGFKSWLANLGASALMTATFYIVFITWLGIVFPRGSLFDLFERGALERQWTLLTACLIRLLRSICSSVSSAFCSARSSVCCPDSGRHRRSPFCSRSR